MQITKTIIMHDCDLGCLEYTKFNKVIPKLVHIMSFHLVDRTDLRITLLSFVHSE